MNNKDIASDYYDYFNHDRVDSEDIEAMINKIREVERSEISKHLRENGICPCKAGLPTFMAQPCGHVEFSQKAKNIAKLKNHFKVPLIDVYSEFQLRRRFIFPIAFIDKDGEILKIQNQKELDELELKYKNK